MRKGRAHRKGSAEDRPDGRVPFLRAGGSAGHGSGGQHGSDRQHDAAFLPRGHTPFTNRKPSKELAENVVENLEVVTPGITTPVRRLSGGNVQKVLVGREIASRRPCF